MKRLTLTLAICTVGKILMAQNFNLDLRSNVSYPGFTSSGCWAYVDGQTEYALVGTAFGVSVVDITDPDNPVVIQNVYHNPSFWREIKTYGHYAYATNEDGGGVLVMDLSGLPDTVVQSAFIYTDQDGIQQTDGHTLWIDEKGRLFIFGGDTYGIGGATIFDLTADPLNPPFIGTYQEHYIHDGFVRGDTLWASLIYDGHLEIIDVSDPSSPVSMAVFTTPSFGTHNSWPTSDNKYVFTTDEVPGSFLTSYDVSDFGNITEADRIQSESGTFVIVHNVHLLNDTFAVTAYYCDGVVIFDVADPSNMIKVASFDNYAGACYAFNGTWSVYPWLPSGNLIAGNIEGGLFVFTPQYVPAARLEGVVTDLSTGSALNHVYVEVSAASLFDSTGITGEYKTGTVQAGLYSVKFMKSGYLAKTVDSVGLVNGATTVLNVQLEPSPAIALSGTVVDSVTGQPLPNAQIVFDDQLGLTYTVSADANGNFSINPFLSGVYSITGGHWGHAQKEITDDISITNDSLIIELPRGYYDDFYFDLGWVASGTAVSGLWVRGEPIGTGTTGSLYNPEYDLEDDLGDECYMTGNGGGQSGNDEVDSGYARLTSPVFDLSGYNNPRISFNFWLAATFLGVTDTFTVYLSNGNTTVAVQKHLVSFTTQRQWLYEEFLVDDYLAPTSNMTISFNIGDYSAANIIEIAIDRFEVTDHPFNTGIADEEIQLTVSLYPNPFTETQSIQYNFSNRNSAALSLEVFDVIGKKVETIRLRESEGIITWGSHLDPGFYMINFTADEKLLKQVKAIKID